MMLYLAQASTEWLVGCDETTVDDMLQRYGTCNSIHTVLRLLYCSWREVLKNNGDSNEILSQIEKWQSAMRAVREIAAKVCTWLQLALVI